MHWLHDALAEPIIAGHDGMIAGAAVPERIDHPARRRTSKNRSALLSARFSCYQWRGRWAQGSDRQPHPQHVRIQPKR
jgi:hypothetical protein